MAIRINYRDLGILNNRGFLQNYITKNPLTATVKFASINWWPIKVEPIIIEFDHPGLLTLCYIYSEARYTYTQITNPALKKAMTAKTLSPKIPNAKYSDQDTTRRSVLGYMQHGIMHDVLGNYTNKNHIYT